MQFQSRMFAAVCGCALGLVPLSVAAQTLQLPTFNYTTVNTTVSVPDGGTMSLGGVSRASSGSSSRGLPLVGKVPYGNRLFNNQGIGQSRGASNFSVTATIIDHAELDEMVLGEAARRTARGDSPLRLGAAPSAEHCRGLELAGHIAAQPEWLPAGEVEPAREPAVESLAEVQQRNEAARATRAREALNYYEKATALEAEGKSGAAKVYYQMAARRAEGDLQQQIALRLEALTGTRIAASP